jgi:hypothetical protein
MDGHALPADGKPMCILYMLVHVKSKHGPKPRGCLSAAAPQYLRCRSTCLQHSLQATIVCGFMDTAQLDTARALEWTAL